MKAKVYVTLKKGVLDPQGSAVGKTLHRTGYEEVKDVRIGMRLEAVWVDDADLRPNLESIKYFRPIDEPDVEVIQPGAGVTW